MRSLDEVREYQSGYDYMGNIERSEERKRANSEYFTPMSVVNDILDEFDDLLFTDSSKTFLDPSCGDGQFLVGVLLRKMEMGIGFKESLECIYGVDLLMDNVELCRERLLCGVEEYRYIVERNIVCADGLAYDYSFGRV